MILLEINTAVYFLGDLNKYIKKIKSKNEKKIPKTNLVPSGEKVSRKHSDTK